MKENLRSNKKKQIPINIFFMSIAIRLANEALKNGDFPVGCVIEYNGEVISKGFRTKSIGKKFNEINHAEINALKILSSSVRDRSKISIYITLEPCLMCFGAILLSGIGRIIFAYEDIMGGGMKCDLSELPFLYSTSNIIVISKILRKNSLFLFKSFFYDSKNEYWRNSKLSHYTLNQKI